MAKVFNTTGICVPQEHYMVNIEKRLEQIKKLVDEGKYFSVNKARQYGKTTTLMALGKYLQKQYYVVSMDFQTFGNAEFQTENRFSLSFAASFLRLFQKNSPAMSDILQQAVDALARSVRQMPAYFALKMLFEQLSEICEASDKPLVLIIDEVDSEANNQVFVDFLAQLRAQYLNRFCQAAFWSVILAGVYDIRHLKQKLRQDEEHRMNSPWNIAAEFKVEFSFSKDEIAAMLREYGKEQPVQMDIGAMAGLLWDYTEGYPFLVSRLCQLLDEEVSAKAEYASKEAAWTKKGFHEAARLILWDKNTLFASLTGKLHDYPKLGVMLRTLLFTGRTFSYRADGNIIDIASMFGFIKNQNGTVAIANRIFETYLYNYFLSEDEMRETELYKASLQDKSQFLTGGYLNMRRVLEKFVEHFQDIYGSRSRTFLEEEGSRIKKEKNMRYFNTEGICKPDVHYMVRLDNRLREIRRLYIDRGKYFVINRGRQYGKTTTLMALADHLKDAYAVLPMDFQRFSSASFADEHVFSAKFIEYLERLFLQRESLKAYLCQDAVHALAEQKAKGNLSMDLLFAGLSRLCGTAKRPVVLIIDEVDSASGNEVFIEFLAQLRAYFLDRENSPMFHSVILAGVYDIKNLKRRIRPDKERRYNSPWNIAADFDMDMSFSAVQIQKMLEEYEADRQIGMQVAAVADEIYQYTSGYPYLVSAICKVIDEKLPDTLFMANNAHIWTREGIGEAVKMLLDKRLPLFDSMMRQISEYPDLKQMLFSMLFQGETFAYNPDHPVIELACMFGYMKNSNKTVQVANRMFEMRLYNLFLSEQELSSTMSRLAKREKNQFIKDVFILEKTRNQASKRFALETKQLSKQSYKRLPAHWRGKQMDEIKLGTIGSGVIVHAFLDNVKITEGIRLAAVYSRSMETGKALAAEYGAQRVYTDMDAFLSDEEVNTVYIATPNLLHYEQTKKALLAGKHVICEKPFCTKAKQARELVALAKQRQLFLVDAVPTAFLPHFEVLKRELPKIGKVKLVQANYSQYSSRYDLLKKGEVPNIFDPAFGGGCLMDINFYNIYLNIALFGKPLDTAYYPNRYAGMADTSGIMVMQYDGFVSESTGAKDTWGVNFFQIEGEEGYIYVKGGSNGLAEVQVVTKTSDDTFHLQENPDRLFYEVQGVTRFLLDDDRDAAFERLSVMPDVIEVLETARKKAGILFPGEEMAASDRIQ